MRSNPLSTISLAALAVLLVGIAGGCGSDSPLNAQSIGGMVGGSTGAAIKGTGKLADAEALGAKDEEPLGQAMSVVLAGEYGLSTDDALTQYVNLVGLTVAMSSPRPNGTWVFGVLDSDDVNAFSGPGGYIFVTRGALKLMQNEAELAGVLGHEIAHVVNRDGIEQVKAAKRKEAVGEFMKADDTAAQFAQAADLGVDVLTKSGYSRPQEERADVAAVGYLRDAGYDPRAYLAFVQRMGQGASSGGSIMSTHPSDTQRASRIAAEIGTAPAGQTNPERFAAAVKK